MEAPPLLGRCRRTAGPESGHHDRERSCHHQQDRSGDRVQGGDPDEEPNGHNGALEEGREVAAEVALETVEATGEGDGEPADSIRSDRWSTGHGGQCVLHQCVTSSACPAGGDHVHEVTDDEERGHRADEQPEGSAIERSTVDNGSDEGPEGCRLERHGHSHGGEEEPDGRDQAHALRGGRQQAPVVVAQGEGACRSTHGRTPTARRGEHCTMASAYRRPSGSPRGWNH